jgi:delta24-sterol reductase
MLVPIADLQRSLEMFDKEVAIYPIWLCPFKLPPNPGMLAIKSEKEQM